MNANNLVNWFSIILGILTLLLAYIGYMTFTLQSKMERRLKEEGKRVNKEQERSFNIRIKLIDYIIQYLTQLHGIEDIENKRLKIYAIQNVLRVINGDENEQIIALRALQGMGKEIIFLIPLIEQFKNSHIWNRKLESEYLEILERIQNS